MIKLRIVALAISITSVFGAIAHGAEKKGNRKAHKDTAPVVYIDASGPSAPESEFPTVSDKGKL